jgi:hypothetical protein
MHHSTGSSIGGTKMAAAAVAVSAGLPAKSNSNLLE